ncbi:antibiotic biosynthesis monooxygenase family protein [Leisingera sp. McT4-56]|uniref:antibiotic biosynthesis monooxygenase family protein n=1 Tax=Leisingera sp. McT4-56 TaxID=2881255 RepID=UPI001CF8F31E|nr:antibiotic biosynthesis monooxygenase family protein [Leisingera sp. McT4-56]MCB4456724.1 antibiotic biosynthesis monooxygenase [Leisingera sp. McT4-56]
MVNFKPLDPAFPIDQQLGVEAGPVVLVNLFTVDPAEQGALVGAWRNDALWMKKQPGYISTQLHKAVGDGSMYMNYAVWDSVADFRAAFSNPEFQQQLSHYPSSAVAAPHLFEKVAVPDCCTS